MDAATLFMGAESGVDNAADELFRRINDKGDEGLPESESENNAEDEATEPTEDTHSDDTDTEDGEGDDNEGTEEDEGDDESEEDEGAEPAPKSKKVILEHDAEAYVKHKVDGKDVEIKVSDLTRLYGQEASLTRKSTEVAELRKATETNQQKYVGGLEKLLERAKSRFEPYSKINWLAISKDPTVSPEDAQSLYAEATKVYEDVQFLEQSLDAVVKDVHQARHAELVKQGQEAWKVLSDPTTGIKGWGDKMYGEVTKFAVDNGMNPEVIKHLVDPSAIKLLHKAMLFDKGKTASTKTNKVNKTPKKIIKESAETATSQVRKTKANDADRRLKETGSLDDATAAFLARMSKD